VLEADHSALRLVASIEGKQPAVVIHAALSEYIENHRDELVGVFARAQQAIAAGDLDGLTAMLNEATQQEAHDLHADIASLTS
jgi:hypothetical protein